MNPNDANPLMDSILYLLIPLALLLGGAFLFCFLKGVFSGQWDDLETPAHRILENDHQEPKK